MEGLTVASFAIAIVALLFASSLRSQVIALREQLEDLDEDVTRWMSEKTA